MRIKEKFIFTVPDKISDKLYVDIGQQRAKGVGSGFNVIEVFQDTKEYVVILAFLKENKIDYTSMEDQIYTKAELMACPALRIVPNGHKGGYPQPEDTYFKVLFDPKIGCQYCSNGHIQIQPIRLRSSIKMGKTDISGVWWLRELIISKKLKELLESEKVTGCEFWPIIMHGKNVPFEDIFQLKIVGKMPPMAEQTNIFHDTGFNNQYGSKCRNGCGFKTVHGEVYYHQKDIENMPDFALTEEWFGINLAYWRWPFMSNKVYKLFLEHKIKGVRFYPSVIL